MTTTALERRRKALPTTKPTAAKTMYAAVVHDFERPLVLEEVAMPVAGPGEIVVRVEASGLCHTDIHAAHGDWPIKPTPPFTPGHEGVGIVERGRLRRDRGRPRRSRRDPVARLRVRDLRLLRERMGDPLPRAEEHGLLARRVVRRLREGLRPVRGQGAGRRRSDRRRTAHLRGSHDVQGGQGRRHEAVGSRRGLRRRRARPSRDPVRGDRRRARDRRRPLRREARARPRARRGVHGQRGEAGSGGVHQGAGRSRPGDRAGRQPCTRSSRRTARCAAEGRSSSSPFRRRTTSSCRSSRPS